MIDGHHLVPKPRRTEARSIGRLGALGKTTWRYECGDIQVHGGIRLVSSHWSSHQLSHGDCIGSFITPAGAEVKQSVIRLVFVGQTGG